MVNLLAFAAKLSFYGPKTCSKCKYAWKPIARPSVTLQLKHGTGYPLNRSFENPQ